MKSTRIAPEQFSRLWRVNFFNMRQEVQASPLETRQLKRHAARQLSKQMAKVSVKQPQGKPSWRVSRTARRLKARNMARKLGLDFVSRQFHFG